MGAAAAVMVATTTTKARVMVGVKPAVINRRACRAARRVVEERRAQARAERFAGRMLVRVQRRAEQRVDLWRMDARYWQARRCGWDPLGDELRPVVGVDAATGRPVRMEPERTPFWRWWSGLRFVDRDAVVFESRRMRRTLP